jgi:hypothetical protein
MIITGYADARELLQDGLDVAILEKPFTPEKLHAALYSYSKIRVVKSINEAG